MGKPGKKASNIFQNPGIKNNNGVKLPFIKGIGSPLKYGKSPMQFNATLKKAAADGKLDNNPKFKAVVENSPAKKKDPGAVIGAAEDRITEIANSNKSYKAKQRKTQRQVKKVDKVTDVNASRKDRMSRAKTLLEREGVKSPAKKYKSAAQRKAVHASKADGGAGHPDKKKSPAKKYGHKSPAKKYATSKSSPMKKSTVKVKDLPKEAAKLGKKGIDAVKKLGSKIGNITINDPEKKALKKKQKDERKALRNKQKQEKKSPAKKKGCYKK